MAGTALGIALCLAMAGAGEDDRGTLLPDVRVRFEVGKAHLDPESERALDRMAAVLKERPELDWVLIVGHTDDRGGEQANRELSTRRATTVRDALVRRGIDAQRLAVMGAGATEPLSREPTPEAKALNRRVDLWVAPQVPIAVVSWIHRRVEARAPIAPEWAPAELRMPLRRLFQVRTLRDSAGEVTFDDDNKLGLGPDALVVIYENPRAKKHPGPASKRVADVEIAEGDVFARLARLEGRAVAVHTEAAEIALAASKARVAHRRWRAASTVSVYQGKAKVAAQSREVEVGQGQGTRVRNGSPPEPPRPLIAAPAWVGLDPLVVIGTSTAPLEWTAAVGTSTVEVSLAIAGDPTLERPIAVRHFREGRGEIAAPGEGAFWVRLTAEDERGVHGLLGAPVRLIVLPAPTDAAGHPRDVVNGAIVLPGPGVVALASPPGTRLTLDDPRGVLRVQDGLRFSTPGLSRVRYTLALEDGKLFGEGVLRVNVGKARVVRDEGARTQTRSYVQVRVLGDDGSPIEGLRLAAQDLDAGGTKPGDSFAPCRCTLPEHALPLEAADGAYLLTLPAGHSPLVRVFDRDSGLAQVIEVPVAPPPAEKPRQRSGFLAAARAGTQIAPDGTQAPWVAAAIGMRLDAGGPLAIDAALELGWVRRELDAGRIDVLPGRVRAALAGNWGRFLAYAGGSAGVDIVRGSAAGSKSLYPGWSALGGVGYTIGPGQIVLEAAYGRVLLDTGEDLGGITFSAGYALLPWWTAPPR